MIQYIKKNIIPILGQVSFQKDVRIGVTEFCNGPSRHFSPVLPFSLPHSFVLAELNMEEIG